MIKHLNKNRICDFKRIFFNQGNSDNTKEIKRIFHYSNNTETNVFPIPAQKLRIQTNYDDWKMESRIMSSYSIVYPVPVIDCENTKMEKIRIDVIPFPENAAWKVSYSDNYPSNLSSIHSNEIHHGKKTLGFEIPVPDKIGYTEYKINFTAINSDCEVQTFAFYCVKYAKEHVISVQNDADTQYQAYLEVQNELVAAYNELREECAQKYFHKAYGELEEDQQKTIAKIYPQKISEAEPKNYSK